MAKRPEVRWCLPRGVRADVYDNACASRRALDRLADKWSTLVTGALSTGPQRFGQLSRIIPGVSPKMLTQTLRSLERDGMLTRTQHPTIPPQVEYELTSLGGGLEVLHQQVRSWAEDHVEEIETARLRYEQRERASGEGADRPRPRSGPAA